MIEKYKYILSKVLLDKSDKVAINEINNLMEYEKVVLNKYMVPPDKSRIYSLT